MENRQVVYEFIRARLVKGCWVGLVVERGDGKLRRVRGIVLNNPILFLRKMDGTVENIPIARIVKCEEWLSPKEAKEMMIKARAYRLAREMQKRERLIARYDRFLISRLREEGRLR